MSNYISSSSPHLHSTDTISGIMYSVLIALIPAVIYSIYIFGLNSLNLILASTISAVVTEGVIQKARQKKITIFDGSALVTGLLLALTLPPEFPVVLAVLGSIIAIAIGKQAFGGLGYNPFNPALVGRAFLIISFPLEMTTWPKWVGPSAAAIDTQTGATPLNWMKQEGIITEYGALFWGNVSGSLGEVSAFAIILGGLYLFYKGYIDWRIPLSILGSVAVLTFLVGEDPLFHLLAGGLMLGAFFMATDMVTSPITQAGRWIFGLSIGFLVWLIRIYGGFPEGVMFAILLVNTAVPLIDRYTGPAFSRGGDRA